MGKMRRLQCYDTGFITDVQQTAKYLKVKFEICTVYHPYLHALLNKWKSKWSNHKGIYTLCAIMCSLSTLASL